MCGVDLSDACRADAVAGATDALQPLRHGARRLKLHDQVDASDIDAQLQRAGADEGPKIASLQVALHLPPLFF